MSVTENVHAADGVSVTSPGALDRTTPAARCHQCGVHLAREFRFMGTRGRINYRKGARYCSPACRQRAYRARLGGAS